MAHPFVNKNIKTLVISVLRIQKIQVELEDSINITWYFGPYFSHLGYWDVPVKQIIPCSAILSKKSHNDIANFIKKTHNFLRKTKNYLKKNPNDLAKLHPDFSQEEKEKCDGHVGAFSQNLGITAYTLENYSYFKSKFYLTMVVFLKYMIILVLGEMPVLMICLS